jgi:glycosyltransferase involved in cell wall biosynthesis
MPTVLIATDQRDWLGNFAAGYQQLGWDVIGGVTNFELESCRADIVHINWPEELAGWRSPTPLQLQAILERLERWSLRSRIIFSVNNLYPHGQADDAMWFRLYSGLFKYADVVHHFSETSRNSVLARYPESRDRRHVVRVGFNYDRLIPAARPDRSEARRKFGVEPNETVFLCFGALRSWSEIDLIRNAYVRVRLPSKRLLMAARYVEQGSPLEMRLRRGYWRYWQWRQNAIVVTDYVPEGEVYELFDAADVVLVARHDGLSSGIPCLAMSMGRPVIAPGIGGTAEYLEGTQNILYDPASPDQLARAMERTVDLDGERIGAENRRKADGWCWSDIIADCLKALPEAAGRRPGERA